MSTTTFSGPVASQNGFTAGSFTTTQRDALTNVATGTLIFNTTTGLAQVYNGTQWIDAFVVAPSFPVFTYTRKGTITPDLPFAVNPAGTKVVAINAGASNFSLTSYTLGSGWNTTSVTAGATYSAPFSLYNTYYPSMAFNADGTQIITIIQDGSAYVNTMSMSTPYDISTLSNTWVKNSTAIDGGTNRLSFAGTRAYTIDGSGIAYQWDLGSAYNVAAFTGTATASKDLVSLLSLGGTVKSFNVSADGAYGYVLLLNYSYEYILYEVSFGTPYNIATISATPVQTYNLVTMGALDSGPSNGGCVVVDATNTKMLVSGPSNTLAQLTAS